MRLASVSLWGLMELSSRRAMFLVPCRTSCGVRIMPLVPYRSDDSIQTSVETDYLLHDEFCRTVEAHSFGDYFGVWVTTLHIQGNLGIWVYCIQ
ncbi:Protein of unknown function, partial [Gryllus bimaculatus]